MNKCFLFFILGLLFMSNLRADDLYRYKDTTYSVPLLQIKNDSMVVLINKIFEQEKSCQYYNDSLLLSIRIILNPIDTNKNNTNIIFGTYNDRSLELKSKPLGCFYIKNHLCFVYGEVPLNLFQKTDLQLKFNEKILFQTRKLRKREIPIIRKEDMIDDSWSYWYYLYNKNSFELVFHYQPCTEDKISN